jgi:ACS family tartrate transporter-like MFS transporter
MSNGSMSASSNVSSATQGIERRTMHKVWWRIVPLLTLVLLFNYLDKVNIGFAALTMNQALGFSNTVFGAGAGLFAIGYALFAVPSTLLLHRMGARRWMTVIAIAWGLCSAAMACVTRPSELFVVRLLLGVAEAGFTPGAILYFSYWFPSEHRGRSLSAFLLIYPLGLVIGGPLSSAVFAMDGALGLAGWQWLFLIEALPTVVLAAAVFCYITDRPIEAGWLTVAERAWLMERLTSDTPGPDPAHPKSGACQVFQNRRLWILAAVNLGLSTSGIGALFFMPLIIHSIGFSVTNTGLIAALPGIAAAAALPLWGFWTDRAGSREIVVAAACCLIAAGLLGTAYCLPAQSAIATLCIAMVGFNGCLVAFWTLPSAFLGGAAAATGIAFINIVGNLGTFTGPYILGWLSDHTHSYEVGMTSLGALAALSAAIIVSTRARKEGLPRT